MIRPSARTWLASKATGASPTDVARGVLSPWPWGPPFCPQCPRCVGVPGPHPAARGSSGVSGFLQRHQGTQICPWPTQLQPGAWGTVTRCFNEALNKLLPSVGRNELEGLGAGGPAQRLIPELGCRGHRPPSLQQPPPGRRPGGAAAGPAPGCESHYSFQCVTARCFTVFATCDHPSKQSIAFLQSFINDLVTRLVLGAWGCRE